MNRIIYFGPPGCGKTTTLLDVLEQELRAHVPIERIAFLTFTRRARREAVERVEKVLGIKAADLLHFRTIHSMAFRALRLRDGDVLMHKHLAAFGNGMGLKFGSAGVTELAAEGLASQNIGDQMLAIENLSRLRGTTVQYEWNHARSSVDWPTMQHFAKSYNAYKTETGLLDFTDVLSQFVQEKKTIDVDVACIDEAQDLSALQWLTALQAVETAARQYVAADDDQAIYHWAGAEVKVCMELTGERRVLQQSYRLPRKVHALASRIITRIHRRVPKEFRPRDAEGEVKVHANVDSIPLHLDGTWLWLVRNRYLLPPLKASLESQGVVYSQHGATSIVESERAAIYDWERLRTGKSLPVNRLRDVYSFLKSRTQIAHGHKLIPNVNEEEELSMKELRGNHGLLIDGTWFDVLDIPHVRRAYYRKLLRDHGTLKLQPQVQLETIHGAKGAEADNVALFLEQSRRVWDEAHRTPDDETRVLYVGVTRARESLHLIRPQGRWAYDIPHI